MDITAAETAYESNADYFETGSVTKAKAFVTACTKLLRAARDWGQGQSKLAWDLAVIQKEKTEALQWLAANDTTDDSDPGLHRFSFTQFRR